MQFDLLDPVSAPALIDNTVLAGEAIYPLLRQAVVLPVLVGLLALGFFAVRARRLVRPRWIDKLAVVTFLVLAVSTKPDRAQHLNALRAADSWSDPALIHGNYLFVSATTGDSTIALGMFGKVFVFQREPSPYGQNSRATRQLAR